MTVEYNSSFTVKSLIRWFYLALVSLDHASPKDADTLLKLKNKTTVNLETRARCNWEH
jgi:Ni2+-binding GTPase involved in maturation of urease and hydrogenase